MGLIRLQNVFKQFGSRLVLEDVTLELHTGEIAALVGANGVGKTTLLRLIAGQLQPDSGSITFSRGLAVGYLPQEPQLPPAKTLRQAVAEAFSELTSLEGKLQELSEQIAAESDPARRSEHMCQYDRLSASFHAAGGYRFEQRLHEVLGGLGFSTSDYDLPVAALSGGQKCRAALAKLLLQERQFLLFDEPTNHLDIDAVRWLEKFLAGRDGGAIIVSHDRYLLDRLAERVIELAPGDDGGPAARVQCYPGNYSSYVEVRQVRRLTQQRQYQKDQAFIAQQREFIARHHVGRRCKQVRGRRTRLERQLASGELVLHRPSQTKALKLEFAGPASIPTGKELIRVEGLSKQYGQRTLFSNLDLSIQAGRRLGITGPNGTGKTTLLKIILGQVQPDAGRVYLNPITRIGYFAQETESVLSCTPAAQADQDGQSRAARPTAFPDRPGPGPAGRITYADLEPGRTIVQEICAVRPDFLEPQARNYAGRFLFSGEEAFKRVEQLSGGQQSRVRFMKLMLAAPELLILDEPTNHLDIPSREALEAALLEFTGAIVAVSHDRYFLDRIAQCLLVMRPGEVKLYHGNYSYYIDQIERLRAAEPPARTTTKPAADSRPAARPRPRKQPPGHPGRTDSPLARLSLAKLEAFITEREERLARLHERFADPKTYRDPSAINELRDQYEALKRELAEAEQLWIERAEEHD